MHIECEFLQSNVYFSINNVSLPSLQVEVENRDSESTNSAFADAYWVATVLRISGYTALLRYEGFGQDGSKDFWLNLCSERVHPVGWCATKGKPLIPPKSK